ncbi:S1C family serine protease [Cytobacillus purgationiresistens]|nr:trypsin-like peptidase domain-containing protein [Cytobacillus purgationiresistens]
MDQLNEVSRENKPPKNRWFKGMAMTVAGGMLGSVITLTAVNYLPQSQDEPSLASNQIEEQGSNLDVQPVSTANESMADMIENASKAIVGVVNMQKQQANPFVQQQGQAEQEVESGTGSGVIFKKTEDEAYIVTNNHVIEGASNIEVSLHNGDKVKAELIGTDSLTDIAVLKVSGKIDGEVLPFGDSSKLRAGDQVLAIGNPLGLDLSRTVTQGIVSAVDRSIGVSTSAGEWDLDVIQTDAAINPGNSGGALINSAGKLVGINSLKIANNGVEGLGFAIPINEVQTIIDQLLENGKIIRPYLGVGLMNLEEVPPFYSQKLPESVSKGAIVTQVDETSEAAKAGLKAEDILVSIGDKEITNADDLRKYLYKDFEIGDKVEVGFYRNGELQKVEVTLAGNEG